MFKNVMIYRLTSPALSGTSLEQVLRDNAFLPCGLTQEKSVGFAPPRGPEGGALAETVAGQTLVRLATETRSVPADALSRALKERTAQILESTGRERLGKKATRELRDEIHFELLPTAFPKLAYTLAWIDAERGTLVIDAASSGRADEMLSALARSAGLVANPVMTTLSPTAAMANWLLTQEPPANFSVDRECELKAADDSKAVVRYSHHALDIEEIQGHIRHGKVPTRLAMTYAGRVSFVLDASLRLKKLSFLDGVFVDQPGDEKVDAFDADVAILTGEMRELIPALLNDALGGEMQLVSDEVVAQK